MATSKKVVTRDEWEGKLRDAKIRKEDMNRLVMNFLVTEGLVDAAHRFRLESGTQPEIDLATITDRMEVKKAVQSGNVLEAVERINDLNPTILDTNPELYFHLQQQKLIELIRVGKIPEALEFAQEELAPRGEENEAFLEEIEKTVALLVFEDVKNCPYGELLDVSQRLKTASEVNAAILTSQSHEKDPKLPSLLKMLIWTQNHPGGPPHPFPSRERGSERSRGRRNRSPLGLALGRLPAGRRDRRSSPAPLVPSGPGSPAPSRSGSGALAICPPRLRPSGLPPFRHCLPAAELRPLLPVLPLRRCVAARPGQSRWLWPNGSWYI
ncbi:hypothetical protein ZWY2020_031341 [Hordeum vulgare]|nr:hypothetical protein ZWY2020_031341 [Hordeum vulgare]